MVEMSLAPFTSLILNFLMFFLVVFFVVYSYTALALMTVAKRLKQENAWYAWVPILNYVLMAQIAKMPWWPVLLVLGGGLPWIGILFTIAGTVYVAALIWKICEARGKPGWWAVIAIIPIVGWVWSFILWGILAWGKDQTPLPKSLVPKTSPKRRKVRK